MSRKKTTVGTTVSRVIDNDKLPHAVKTGVTKALLQSGEISDYITEEIVASIGTRAERMYAYGKTQYSHGLPSGQFLVGAENIDDVVSTVLLGIENTPVALDYVRYGAPNNLHIGWMKLIATHGYNPATNQLGGLTSSVGLPVFLHDMVVVIPSVDINKIEPQSLELWGVAAKTGPTPARVNVTPESSLLVRPSGVEVEVGGTTEYLRVEYTWATAPEAPALPVIMYDSFTIPITGYDDEADYFHVKYVVGGVTKYWMYRDGAGTHITLDRLFDKPPLANGSFFPFAYFRFNKQSEISNTGTATYQTSKKLVSYLGMDYDRIGESIDANPGIADVEQAMLVMAVPANTTDELERRYLWEFFNNLYLASDPEFRYRSENQAAIYAFDQGQLGLASPGIVIQDTRFKMSLDNWGVYKRRKSGVVGAVGKHYSSVTTQTIAKEYTQTDESGSNTTTVNHTVVSHNYMRQVSTGLYDEIQVVSLRTVFYINGEYSTIGENDSTILIVPLDRAITIGMSIPDRETLYARSLHFVFNSLIVTKVKWYQTGLFQALLLVVAIIITVITYGQTFELVVLALGAGEIAIAAWFALQIILPAVLTSLAFRLAVKELGVKAAFVVAILAAVIAGGQGLDAGSIAGSPTAMELLKLSTGLSSAISAQVQSDIQDLLASASLIGDIQKEELKLLEAGQKLLENKTMLSPFLIFGEKPDDYYNRTVHPGNIGVVGIDAVSSYVSHALKLPELNDTLGDTSYVG